MWRRQSAEDRRLTPRPCPRTAGGTASAVRLPAPAADEGVQATLHELLELGRASSVEGVGVPAELAARGEREALAAERAVADDQLDRGHLDRMGRGARSADRVRHVA